MKHFTFTIYESVLDIWMCLTRQHTRTQYCLINMSTLHYSSYLTHIKIDFATVKGNKCWNEDAWVRDAGKYDTE